MNGDDDWPMSAEDYKMSSYVEPMSGDEERTVKIPRELMPLIVEIGRQHNATPERVARGMFLMGMHAWTQYQGLSHLAGVCEALLIEEAQQNGYPATKEVWMKL